MPSIYTSITPITDFPYRFTSPYGNDAPIPIYSSVPVNSPAGECMPCIVCENRGAFLDAFSQQGALPAPPVPPAISSLQIVSCSDATNPVFHPYNAKFLNDFQPFYNAANDYGFVVAQQNIINNETVEPTFSIGGYRYDEGFQTTLIQFSQNYQGFINGLGQYTAQIQVAGTLASDPTGTTTVIASIEGSLAITAIHSGEWIDGGPDVTVKHEMNILGGADAVWQGTCSQIAHGRTTNEGRLWNWSGPVSIAPSAGLGFATLDGVGIVYGPLCPLTQVEFGNEGNLPLPDFPPNTYETRWTNPTAWLYQEAEMLYALGCFIY
jgi:hypothetical protein